MGKADLETKLEVLAGQLLTTSGLTVALAESCTGGLLGDLLTDVPGSSAYFLGGVVAYHDDLKTVPTRFHNEVRAFQDAPKYLAQSANIAAIELTRSFGGRCSSVTSPWSTRSARSTR